MIDWRAMFEEGEPSHPLGPKELAGFASSLTAPLSREEQDAIRRSQTNPFTSRDEQYSSWRPADPSAWTLPRRPLPPSYLELLTWSDGGEFRRGQRRFQFFQAFDERHGVRAMNLAYMLPKFMPGALAFAFNGGGIFYLFDMRAEPIAGEYPIVCASAGNADFRDCVMIAPSFEKACSGRVDVEKLLYRRD